jgi:hypothetical protein
MNALRAKLTYSNMISTICLFLLLGGGTALAATHLAANSVGTKQLKRGAVKPGKLSRSAKAALEGPAGPQGPQGPDGPRGPQGLSGAQSFVIDAAGVPFLMDTTTHPIALSGTTTWTAPKGEVGHLAFQVATKEATNTAPTAAGGYENCDPSFVIRDNGERVTAVLVPFPNIEPEPTSFHALKSEVKESTLGLLVSGTTHTITAEYIGTGGAGCKPGSALESLRVVVVPEG